MAIAEKTQLALTMRPQGFADVIGLEEAVRVLKTKLDGGEVPRAFLLRGPYGCGKTTLGHIIAHYIQLIANPFFEGKAEIQEVNGANYRKIENMRQLAQDASSYPMQGTYKVIILDECHKLTGDAQDVLLKELEVPHSSTVWILCTTDPGDMNQGVLDRCFPLDVKGMNADERHALIARAAETTGFDDVAAVKKFEALITSYNVVSPRRILGAFELLKSGADVEAAVAATSISATPEYHDIAFAAVFGQWDKDVTLWGKVPVRACGALLRDLEDKLSKKSKSESEEEDKRVDDSDVVDSKPMAAHALRAVLGAFLKGRVLPKALKGGKYKFPTQQDSDRAFKAMYALANTVPASEFELQWSGVVIAIYRVNQIMQKG